MVVDGYVYLRALRIILVVVYSSVMERYNGMDGCPIFFFFFK